jgi:uncharacterized protein (TIGR02453 family)
LKNGIPVFTGFSKNVFGFLNDLTNNNNTKWFNKNRERYLEDLVQPARSFVVGMSDFFNRLNPAIRTEPQFNKTLMRLNKDMRFTKGEPYRNYFLIHFGRFKMDTEFYVYFDPDNFDYGLFINNREDQDNFFFKKNIGRHRKDFLKILDKYEINNKYELLELGKDTQEIVKKFDAHKHLDLLMDLKMAILQKSLKQKDKRIYSPDFIIEAIKTFSNLYPLYCFSVSPQPLKLVEEFENLFGIIV